MYKPGTRVKKVRGSDIGHTGLVVATNELGMTAEEYVYSVDDPEYDICIREDQDWMDTEGYHWPAGTVSFTRSFQWEPIIPDGSDVPAEVSMQDLLETYRYEEAEPLHTSA